MTQLYPSTEYQSKAVALIMEMKNLIFESQSEVNAEKINAKFRDIQTRFSALIGKPMTQYEPFVHGEPARSSKVNRFIENLQKDLNILEEQMTLIKASAVLIHNTMVDQIDQAKHQNAAAINQLKTLQLYTSAQNSEVTIFGDYFKSSNQIDYQGVDAKNRALIEVEGRLTLAKDNISEKNSLSSASMKILSTSNGIPGRLIEIEEVTQRTPTNPITQEKLYRFKAQIDPRSNMLFMVDNSPATWFEYEKNLVSDEDRLKANNFNFTYTNAINNTAKGVAEVNYPVGLNESIDWADGPANNVLKLDLEFDLKAATAVNEITYTPFGLLDNSSPPVLIKFVETSLDKNNWETLYPTNVSVAQDSNLYTARFAEQITSGSARWDVRSDTIRYIRFHIEQHNSSDSKIGHVYYTTPRRIVRTAKLDQATPVIEEKVVGGERAKGPTPTTTAPTKFYDPSFSIIDSPNLNSSSGLVKRVEIFDGKRWSIGIRDISATKCQYVSTSSMVSKPFKIAGTIDRVSLDSSLYIPESFPSTSLWVRYYVSADNGVSWVPISRIQDDYLGIPEVLAFNDTIPVQFREQNVGYYTVAGRVNSLRVKIELSRPSDQKNKTPVVYWYKLKITRK